MPRPSNIDGMRSRTIAALLATSVLVVVAGCGGDDATGTTEAETTTPAEPATTLATTTTVGATTTSTTTSTTTTSTTTSTTTTTEPEPEPVDHAQQFLDIVGPVNCAIVAVNDAWEEVLGEDDQYFESDWPIIQAVLLTAYLGFAEAYDTAATELAAASWPEELQPEIDQLSANWEAEGEVAREVAAAVSFAEFTDALAGFTGGGSSVAIREALELPPPDPATFVCDDPST